MVSVGVAGKDVGGATLPILKVGRPFAVERKFRTVSKVPDEGVIILTALFAAEA